MVDPQDPGLAGYLGDYPAQEEAQPPPEDLALYLDYLYSGGDRGPAHLSIPAWMTAEFNELFQTAEGAGLEHGYALLYDSKTRGFGRGATIIGNSNSINPLEMPEIGNPDCFGFVHAHPSKSIGHAGGYSPHSVEDLLTFEYWCHKSFYFLFVVSGPKLYAMIYIAGASAWNDGVKSYLNERLGISQSDARKLIYAAAGGQKAYEDGYQNLEAENDAAEKYRMSLIARMPEFGKRMEDIAMRECVSFASKYRYAFVVWTSPQPSQ
jgi:hypothetical protein